jgi:hypothetical protein
VAVIRLTLNKSNNSIDVDDAGGMASRFDPQPQEPLQIIKWQLQNAPGAHFEGFQWLPPKMPPAGIFGNFEPLDWAGWASMANLYPDPRGNADKWYYQLTVVDSDGTVYQVPAPTSRIGGGGGPNITNK